MSSKSPKRAGLSDSCPQPLLIVRHASRSAASVDSRSSCRSEFDLSCSVSASDGVVLAQALCPRAVLLQRCVARERTGLKWGSSPRLTIELCSTTGQVRLPCTPSVRADPRRSSLARLVRASRASLVADRPHSRCVGRRTAPFARDHHRRPPAQGRGAHQDSLHGSLPHRTSPVCSVARRADTGTQDVFTVSSTSAGMTTDRRSSPEMTPRERSRSCLATRAAVLSSRSARESRTSRWATMSSP